MGEGNARPSVVEFQYTADQLAALWQVHSKTVKRRCEEGLIPGAWLDDAGWRIPASGAVEYQRLRTLKSVEAAA